MKSMEKSEKKSKKKIVLSILASASRIFLAVFLVLFSICVIAISLALQPLISVYSDLKNVENEITTLTKIDIPSKDLTRLDQRLDNIDKSLASIEDEIGKYHTRSEK
jgi:cell division protein FtsL